MAFIVCSRQKDYECTDMVLHFLFWICEKACGSFVNTEGTKMNLMYSELSLELYSKKLKEEEGLQSLHVVFEREEIEMKSTRVCSVYDQPM